MLYTAYSLNLTPLDKRSYKDRRFFISSNLGMTGSGSSSRGAALGTSPENIRLILDSNSIRPRKIPKLQKGSLAHQSITLTCKIFPIVDLHWLRKAPIGKALILFRTLSTSSHLYFYFKLMTLLSVDYILESGYVMHFCEL